MSGLKEIVQALVDPLIKTQAVFGTVKSVDMDAKTCDVEVEEGFIRYEVKLTAEEDQADTGLILEPKVGSWVVAAMLEGSSSVWYVALFSELNTARLKNDSGAELLLKDNGETHLHGDQFKGLVKVEVAKNNFNSLKNYVEAMNAAIPAALTAIGAAMSANGATGATTYTNTMQTQSINIQDMENKNVKHG